MAIDNQRNYSFDFLKLFYTIIIIIHHSNLLNNVMLRGYIPVEFFFFISGYFIYSTSKRNITFIQFVKRRIQKLYPGYLHIGVRYCEIFVNELIRIDEMK